jgi:polyferredoxin
MYHKNPTNGHEVFGADNWAILWTLLFGPLYFMYKGVWKHFFLSIIIAFMTLGISWLVYIFLAKDIVNNQYLHNGWISVHKD